MSYKRILTIQDISCIGQCSMTVALPILSACGHEVCILPTTMLSTHTGGFGKPAVLNLTDSAREIIGHWKSNDIAFDLIYTGYLGSIPAIEVASEIMDTMLAPGGITIADPAMADHGKLYSGFDDTYAHAMKALCEKADVMLPNVTEAALMTGLPYRENLNVDYVLELLERLGGREVVLTGVGFKPEETGFAVRSEDGVRMYHHEKIGKNFHGTGDIFASSFVGSLACGKSLPDAAEIAGRYTCSCIRSTFENPAHWYGVKFETVLPELIQLLNR